MGDCCCCCCDCCWCCWCCCFRAHGDGHGCASSCGGFRPQHENASTSGRTATMTTVCAWGHSWVLGAEGWCQAKKGRQSARRLPWAPGLCCVPLAVSLHLPLVAVEEGLCFPVQKQAWRLQALCLRLMLYCCCCRWWWCRRSCDAAQVVDDALHAQHVHHSLAHKKKEKHAFGDP